MIRRLWYLFVRIAGWPLHQCAEQMRNLKAEVDRLQDRLGRLEAREMMRHGQANLPPLPDAPTSGLWVEAIARGTYGGIFRHAGETFLIADRKHLGAWMQETTEPSPSHKKYIR